MKLLLENWRKFLKENEEQTYQIYCDMDGVLVDFVAGVVDYINEKLQSGTAEELAAEIGRDYITREDIEDNANKAVRTYMYEELKNHADFWRDLPWIEEGKELWNYIVPYDPYILTTPMGYGSEIGKQEWIDKNLNPPPHKVFMSEDKYRWAVTNEKPNILIDDWKKNTIPWEEKGGIAILHIDISETIYKLKELLNETI